MKGEEGEGKKGKGEEGGTEDIEGRTKRRQNIERKVITMKKEGDERENRRRKKWRKR